MPGNSTQKNSGAPSNELRQAANNEDLPMALESAVEMMRADVSMSAEWRSALLRQLSAAPQPSLSAQLPELTRPGFLQRSFTVRPAAAIAAGVLAMVIGGVATATFVKTSDASSASVASIGDDTVVSTSAAPVNRTADGRSVIRFVLVAPGAKRVNLVGDFNSWDATATPLVASSDGTTWLVEMTLAAGRHLYAFVVDGDIVADPSAPRVVDRDFGVQNSVVLVGDS